jgi:hypothetical protein
MQCFRWETLTAVSNSSGASYVNVVNYLQSTPFPYYWSLCSKLGRQVLQSAHGNKIRDPDSRSHGDTYSTPPPPIVRHPRAAYSLITLVGSAKMSQVTEDYCVLLKLRCCRPFAFLLNQVILRSEQHNCKQ